ncbi:MAG: type II toxin-antitoxin system Phd/YefM family antitoxin [Spirochaetaceae bacterium]|nr:type II toxin-antitoxin system Phd/YefM family antitoxin [Spirochaetaceae bacterium]
MGRSWQVQEAKARFSEFLETSLIEGPQIVTKRGVETAVLVSIDQWRRLERRTVPDIKKWLLAPDARTEMLTPPRSPQGHRSTPDFE